MAMGTGTGIQTGTGMRTGMERGALMAMKVRLHSECRWVFQRERRMA